MKVVFSKKSQRQLETAVMWWRAHRESAPHLLEDEIRSAVRQLETSPYAGAPGRDLRMTDVRRLVLRDSRCLLYYRVDEQRGVVEVLRLWHSSRAAPPL